MKRAAMLLSLLACGCVEQEPATVPITLAPRPVEQIEEVPPVIVSPHHRDHAPSDPVQASAGGGGGGSRPPPSAADRARMEQELRARLEQQRFDPNDDPCEQQRQVLGTVSDVVGDGETPSRREMAPCRDLPAALRNCMSPTYQSEHRDECQEQFQALARQGHRQVREARRAQAERAGAPVPREDDDEDEADL